MPDARTGRVTGIGGLFFTCDDADATRAWYADRFGLELDPGGGFWFDWTELDGKTPARTALGPFSSTTDYFDPGTLPFMINYRVDDLSILLDRLTEAGERVIDTGFESEDGRFAWVIDPDGQKVELWEPRQDDQPASSPSAAPPRHEEALVTGVGGVFFKSPDRTALKEWYRGRLGVEPDDAGYVVFSWLGPSREREYLSWEVFADDSDYFSPSERPLMINLRVRDLDAVRERLAEHDPDRLDPNVEEYEYGKFGWVVDPNGTKLELWEPFDRAFD